MSETATAKNVKVEAKPAYKARPYCVVAPEETPEGEIGVVTFTIDPMTWARLKRKMGTLDQGTYLWQNIINRNVQGWVY